MELVSFTYRNGAKQDAIKCNAEHNLLLKGFYSFSTNFKIRNFYISEHLAAVTINISVVCLGKILSSLEEILISLESMLFSYKKILLTLKRILFSEVRILV